MQSRALAATILNRLIVDSLSLNQLLETELACCDDARENSFVRDLCYGVMRWYPQLDFYLQNLLNKPIRKRDLKLKILCWLGLYQIAHQRTADHGAVSATVAACDDLSLPWARGMVNAVLRNFIRRKQALAEEIAANEVARFAHPQWLIDAIRDSWPDEWQSILTANNEQPPMSLRVNLQKTRVEDYEALLDQNGLSSRRLKHCDSGLILDQPRDVSAIPGFDRGLVSVQDGAAQLVAPLLDMAPGLRVLDACAAPGGKTCHILEQAPQPDHVFAIDVNPERLQRISLNLQRLSLKAEIRQADACYPDQWWDGTPFDRILLDAPCSASGIIRRHPDIKYLRQPGDIEIIGAVQIKLLESLWPLLAPGGKLLYVTCSVLKTENDQIIQGFLQSTKTARTEVIGADWGIVTRFGRQNLPGQDDLDGFYFSRLVKQCDET